MMAGGVVYAGTGVAATLPVVALGASVLASGTCVPRGTHTCTCGAVTRSPIVAQAGVLAVVTPSIWQAL